MNRNRTRLSLLYLASYLTLIGFGLLFLPDKTLRLLQSNGEYGTLFPRLVGMLMSGMGISVFGMFRARVPELYPATLVIRVSSSSAHSTTQPSPDGSTWTLRR